MSEVFETIAAKTDVPLFVFGDHASRHIPDMYNNLGLGGEDLTRHIAWDIGTEIIVREMAAHFGCAAQLAKISRLVIDVNRDIRMPCLIPAESDGTYIPGNHALDSAARRARIERYHMPYHAALSAALEAHQNSLAVSVHSFTPKPALGDLRAIDIGLLVKHDPASAEAYQNELKAHFPHYRIGINEPYSAHVLNYTIDTHLGAHGRRHLALEINQALVTDDASARKIARQLIFALEPLLLQTQDNIQGKPIEVQNVI